MEIMRAIGLLSGGLDSQLAIRLMLEQGIEMVAVHFRTIFCTCTPKGCGKSTASQVADELGIPFVEFNNTKEFLDIVKNPPHGYGSGMNPCIDCRLLMFKKAKEYMEEIGAGFIVTGEVLGQRPMSQHKSAMELIERESGLFGLVVRPLSAQILSPTIPEQKGWIDRDKLLAHSGRSRKLQMGLAEKFGMRDYQCAAGGCLLTDPGFSKRIKEGFQHGEDSINDVQLLKVGRHFRLLDKVRLVVGRNEIENKRIINLARNGDILIEPVDVPGPTSLLRKNSCSSIEDYLKLAIYICARYCDGNGDTILRYGIKEGINIIWDKEIGVKVPYKPVISNDYCRRI
jgi:tRNA U34 2-thiouridine synthase MnmA/TrmU